VVAVFLSNIPEGLASAAGMKKAGKSFAQVAGLWTMIALISGLAALTGYVLFDTASRETIAFVQALAAGAILAMIIDTMAPEAFEGTHDFAGLIAVAGFLSAFALSKTA
jgi:ZIP family zinc transporter